MSDENELLAAAFDAAASEQMKIVNWTRPPSDGLQRAIVLEMPHGGPSVDQRDRAALKAEIYSEVAQIIRKA